MREAGVPVGPIHSIADIASDPRFAEREIIINVEDSRFGSLPMHTIASRLSTTPGVLRRPAAGLGEHISEVLEDGRIEPGPVGEGASA